MSPRPRSSRPKTSFSRPSAGASCCTRPTAARMSSVADATARSCAVRAASARSPSSGSRTCPRRSGAAARRDVDAADLEGVHHLPEPLADAFGSAENPVVPHLEAVEDEFGGLDALVAHLLDLGRDPQPGHLLGARLLLADEAGHPHIRG